MGKFPWIDVFCLAVFIRIIYVALRGNVLNEFVKLSGVFVALFFSLQYYSSFLWAVFGKVPFFFSKTWLDAISFLIIFIVCLSVFFLIRKAIRFIFKGGKHALWERITAAVLGVLRAGMLISVFVFFFYMMPFLRIGIKNSVSFKATKNIAPVLYAATYKIYEKINPLTDFNKETSEYYETKDNL